MKKGNKNNLTEPDSKFLLKIVLYVVLASFWVKFSDPLDIYGFMLNGFPAGLCIGLLVASHDRFQIDRKIEYVVLIIVTIISFFIPSGIVI